MNSIKKCQCYAWLFHLFPSTSRWLPETDGAILLPAGSGLTHYRKFTQEKSGADIELSNNWTRLRPRGSPIGDVGRELSHRGTHCGVVWVSHVPEIWKGNDVLDDHRHPGDRPGAPACCQICAANRWQMRRYWVTFHETRRDHKV